MCQRTIIEDNVERRTYLISKQCYLGIGLRFYVLSCLLFLVGFMWITLPENYDDMKNYGNVLGASNASRLSKKALMNGIRIESTPIGKLIVDSGKPSRPIVKGPSGE